MDFKFGSILIDFDGDGDLDVFPSSSGFPIYWAENLNGDFTYFKYNSIERPTNWTSDDPIMVKTYADFDNDGTIEF
ncbi:MAG: VCBS repeat-containing protein [Saprospiraceae bacterium]|nr:VCBS repeat-containing protein [Saprospiraceae bacterium]